MRRYFVAAAAVASLAFAGAILSSRAQEVATPVAEHPIDYPARVTTEPSVTILDHRNVTGVLGREVRGAADEDMGRVINIIVDRTGQVRAAVIDFGGFLGVGSRKIAVDWNVLRFTPDDKKSERLVLGLTMDQVRTAPEYKEDRPIVVVGASNGFDALPLP